MKRLFVGLLALSMLSACNDSNILGGGGSDPIDPEPTPTAAESPTPTPGVDPDDRDGDGIPDADDFIPCMAVILQIWNEGVSAAEIIVNGDVIVDQNTFPTAEVVIVPLNATFGTNDLVLGGKLTGSPSDIMHIQVGNTDGETFLHETIQRPNGNPPDVNLTFDITGDCD